MLSLHLRKKYGSKFPQQSKMAETRVSKFGIKNVLYKFLDIIYQGILKGEV
jgi:hypothetical protein